MAFGRLLIASTNKSLIEILGQIDNSRLLWYFSVENSHLKVTMNTQELKQSKDK
jgi:hypothetical protein